MTRIVCHHCPYCGLELKSRGDELPECLDCHAKFIVIDGRLLNMRTSARHEHIYDGLSKHRSSLTTSRRSA